MIERRRDVRRMWKHVNRRGGKVEKGRERVFPWREVENSARTKRLLSGNVSGVRRDAQAKFAELSAGRRGGTVGK